MSEWFYFSIDSGQKLKIKISFGGETQKEDNKTKDSDDSGNESDVSPRNKGKSPNASPTNKSPSGSKLALLPKETVGKGAFVTTQP